MMTNNKFLSEIKLHSVLKRDKATLCYRCAQTMYAEQQEFIRGDKLHSVISVKTMYAWI